MAAARGLRRKVGTNGTRRSGAIQIGSYAIDGRASYGVLTNGGIVDVGSRIGDRCPDLLSLIRAGALAEAAAAAS